MARKGTRETKADTYRHDDTRKNIPEAGLVDYVSEERKKPTDYCWDPRESPQLIWAGKAGMNKVEVEEQTSIQVPVVDLHIHERASTEAILRSVKRQDAQRNLFADPEMEFTKDIQFYQHDVDWSNRMILGDSLLVMNSLIEREGMRGKVQCIYMDPPYGIKYASNFQPRIDQRDVKDGKDDDLTREVMQVQAFRDTWELGVHSYLTYLRDRLLLSRELLADSGSIFVQIGDENVHRVRCLMDEVFGEENFCGQIAFFKTTSQTSSLAAATIDYLIWYAKDRERIKFRQVYAEKTVETDKAGVYTWLELPNGSRRRMTPQERAGSASMPTGSRIFRLDNMTSQSGGETTGFTFQLNGKRLTSGKGFWKTNRSGMDRLASANRVTPSGISLAYIRYIDDFAAYPFANLWTDTGTGSFTEDKAYAVQTAEKVIQRCILMTTDPGDLVLDPTCGSGTTAYVAEQWGRRWITMDTSRVALAIARHRLMTAAFDYYKLRHPTSGVSGGFVYKTVPHITLKSIAQNPDIDAIAEEFKPKIAGALATLNQAEGKDWKEWEVPRPQTPGGEPQNPGGEPQNLGGEPQNLGGEPQKLGGEPQNLGGEPQTPGGEPQNPGGEPQNLGGEPQNPGGEPQNLEGEPSAGAGSALASFWSLKREMQAKIDASIAKNAPIEELVDQPDKERGIVRVSGPFTVEGLPNLGAEMTISVESEVVPADEWDDMAALGVSIFQREESRMAALNVNAYLSGMIDQLRKSGVMLQCGKKKLEFERIQPVSHEIVHAEGEAILPNGGAETKRYRTAVVFGPPNGALSELNVRDGIRASAPYEAVLFCGYEFTGAAQEVVSVGMAGKQIWMSLIAPDTAMDDLLKTSKTSQVFAMIGEPDLIVHVNGHYEGEQQRQALQEELKNSDAENKAFLNEVLARIHGTRAGEIIVALRGVDIYDPTTGETSHDAGSNVHAIFVDHDYDGNSFCICQAMFPNKKDSWTKIAKNLKASIDEDAFDAMRTRVSLPFKPGEKVQIKVIDARGSAIIKTISVEHL